MKPHKISTHSAHSEHSENCYFYFFYRLSDLVEILRGFTKFCFKQMLKVSAFYLEKQKSFIPKTIWSKPYGQNSSFLDQQMAPWWRNFGMKILLSIICFYGRKVFQKFLFLTNFFATFSNDFYINHKKNCISLYKLCYLHNLNGSNNSMFFSGSL